jgi:CHAT domain-containing protein
VNSDRKISTTLRHSKREMIMELTRNIHMAISSDKKKQNPYFWTAYSVFTMPKE